MLDDSRIGALEHRKPEPAREVHVAPGAVVPSATAAAQSGPDHVESPTAYDGVLLLGFGGPEGQEDVIPFLRNVTRGRGVPDERLEEVARHYRSFGGVSPINDHNRKLRAALEAELASRGRPLPVYWGNRNWAPFLAEALADAHVAGHTRLLAIATSAFSSYSSCRQYREDLADAVEAVGLAGAVEIDKVRPFFDHPGFLDPVTEDLARAFEDPELEAGESPTGVEVMFCTHSIPVADARLSGPEERREDSGWGDGGAYEAQHRAAAAAVMERLDRPGVPWRLVYQSRSGPASVPWLEPDVNDAIAEAARTGRRAVVLVPLGFVSDHMEVLWDLDVEAKETAREHGVAVRRTATPGVHPRFVEGLADLVIERAEGTPAAERPHLTDLGPWYDVCRPGCCASARNGTRPALCGIAP